LKEPTGVRGVFARSTNLVHGTHSALRLSPQWRVDDARRRGDAPVLSVRGALAWPGIIIGLFLVVGSLEFVGRFEERGWKLAGAIVPITYIACLTGSSAASKEPGLKQ
jgi:hypothetical protein